MRRSPFFHPGKSKSIQKKRALRPVFFISDGK